MLIISQLRLPIDHSDADLRRAVGRQLRCPVAALKTFTIDQRATDARRGTVEFIYTVLVTVDDEASLLKDADPKRVAVAPDTTYRQLENLPDITPKRVVIVGTGPCGLACGLVLARQGWKPILLERGKMAGDRARDVTGFWRRNWPFDPQSNVQFGEGGAGTFSDGKLYTQIRDREHRIPWLLQEFVKAGAPEDILYKSRPHIGTDRLIKVVRTLREEIISLGGEVRFQSHVTDVTITDGTMRSVTVGDGTVVEADAFVFAVGHSSRDTFEMLHRRGVPMERKPFAVGVRIEHPQGMIDQSQYGQFAGNERLGAAAYRFVSHCDTGRSAYSFCMCPGGLVVAAGSEPGMVVSNGMSSYARAEANANSGFMVEVRETDFPGDHALAGIEFQRDLERKAFELGGGNYFAPAQRLEDFMRNVRSTGPGKVKPSYEPGVTWTNLAEILPDYITATLRESVRKLSRQIPGFDHPDAVLTGVETRSSSPIRIPRCPGSFQCDGIDGFLPVGEGAGYAGGIISAAVDGMRAAERLLAGRTRYPASTDRTDESTD
jgi:uncharacterized protein